MLATMTRLWRKNCGSAFARHDLAELGSPPGHAYSYDVVALGYNYRIDEMRSALGRVQLRKLPAGNQHRAELTTLYRECWRNWPAGGTAFESRVAAPVITSCRSCCRRAPIASALWKLSSRRHPDQHSLPPRASFQIYQAEWQKRAGSLPLTEEVGKREVTLPLYSSMRPEQVHWLPRP